MGNIRSGGAQSDGFGFYYTASGGSRTEIGRFGTGGTFNTLGAITQNGSQVLTAANYNSYSPTLTGTGASGSWGISVTGNAATATVLQTARTINGTSFNGSANITVTANTTNTLTLGSYLTGTSFNGSAAVTAAVDATSANTASKVVARDASGNFSAGTITATLTGQAASATVLVSQDIRTLSPSSTTVSRLAFGFTSWANNNTSPWADYLAMRSYQDASGGNDNLLLLNKSTIAMRVYQQAFGSATAYSSFADVLMTNNYNSYAPTLTGTGASGTWGISVTGSAGSATTATNATNVAVTTSATASAFKVPFANTTASTTGNYGLLQDSEATFTYNPSTNTLTAGTFSGALSGNASTATTATTATNTSGGNVQGSYLGVQNTSGSTGYGLSLYNGSSAGQPQYGIMFAQTASFGTYGNVTADWATYFTMDSTANRGWIFRDTASGNKASISNLGDMSLARSLGVGTAGSGTAGEIRATNNVTAYYSSDIKFKENVRSIPNAAATAKAIGGKLFDWKDSYIEEHGGEDGYFIQKADFGIIAQDAQKHFPICVRTRPDGSLAVDYEKLSALALAAIAEQETRIQKLEALVAKLIEG